MAEEEVLCPEIGPNGGSLANARPLIRRERSGTVRGVTYPAPDKHRFFERCRHIGNVPGYRPWSELPKL